MSLIAIEVNKNAPPVEVEAPPMAWEGSHMTLDQAMAVLDVVVKYAAGKPATDEVLSALPLPAGITIEDARDCIFWATQMKQAMVSERADQRVTASVALQAAMTVRARLKAAGKALLGPGKFLKLDKNRARMAKKSRRMNRRR